MSMFLAGKPRNSKQPKGMCALKISPHSFIAVTLVICVPSTSVESISKWAFINIQNIKYTENYYITFIL